MKQNPQQAKKPSTTIAPELKQLHSKAESAKKAAAKSLELFEIEARKYQNILHESPGKLAAFEGLCAIKIAKFSYKIKKIEHKLAQSALKFAKKDLKKAAKASIGVKDDDQKNAGKGAKKGTSSKG